MMQLHKPPRDSDGERVNVIPLSGDARLADHLGLTDFRILGISGGAPYAFATAWAIPQRVRAIAVVSGAPPITELADQTGLLPLYRWMLGLYRYSPRLLRVMFGAVRP